MKPTHRESACENLITGLTPVLIVAGMRVGVLTAGRKDRGTACLSQAARVGLA